MILEYTVNMGSIFTILTMVVLSSAFIYTMKNEISLVKSDVKHLEDSQRSLVEAFNQLGKILTQVAVQDNRINMIEKRFDELTHGRGFVRDHVEKK